MKAFKVFFKKEEVAEFDYLYEARDYIVEMMDVDSDLKISDFGIYAQIKIG